MLLLLDSRLRKPLSLETLNHFFDRRNKKDRTRQLADEQQCISGDELELTRHFSLGMPTVYFEESDVDICPEAPI